MSLIGVVVAFGLCLLVLSSTGAAWWLFGRASRPDQPAVEYVLDASARMAATAEGATRLEVAQAVLAEVVRSGNPAVMAGLRVFGAVAPASCEASDLIVPLALASHGLISDRLLAVQPGTGVDAPLGQAMLAAVRDLRMARGPHTLVVVSGGGDSCSPDGAQLVANAAASAGIDIALYFVGFQADDAEVTALKALVETLPGAEYFDAASEDELLQILSAIQATVDDPSALPVAEAIATARAALPTTPATAVHVSQTACDHPYFPLRLGATWHYRSSLGLEFDWTVTEVAGDQSRATATVLNSIHDPPYQLHFECGPEGIISYNVDYIVNDDSDQPAVFTVQETSGVWLPPAQQFAAPIAWTFVHTVVYDVSPQAGRQRTVFTTRAGSLPGVTRPLTIGAETFDALDVTFMITRDSHFTNSTDTRHEQRTAVFTLSYGVGMLHYSSEQTTRSGSSAAETSLLSYYIPPAP
jgi:hypothetical protein